MIRFRSIARGITALYALIVGMTAIVCATVIFHVLRMRTDSRRVLEETREQQVALQLRGDVRYLRDHLGADRLDVEEVGHLQKVFAEVLLAVRGLEAPPGDPSRDEHQRQEQLLGGRLLSNLEWGAERMVGAMSEEVRGSVDRYLVQANRFAEELLEETRHEARIAVDDFERHARATEWITLGTVIGAATSLGVAMFFAYRGLLAPLGDLREGARRLGRGDLDRRIPVSEVEELGALAESFNEMAQQVAGTQRDLEQAIRDRTKQFLGAARLADLGILASGVAHEVNTPLASITSCAEGLERRFARGSVEPHVVSEYLETIRSEAFRARDITDHMLSLAREEPGAVASVDVSFVVEQSISALRHQRKARCVEVVRDLAGVEEPLAANGGELTQILINLLANAIDASPAGGEVIVRAFYRGPSLILEVIDSGEGIPEADRARVFEPFFTTKARGAGTGLGLALVSALVDSHGGRVTVQSAEGQGSVFRVEVPRDWSPAAKK